VKSAGVGEAPVGEVEAAAEHCRDSGLHVALAGGGVDASHLLDAGNVADADGVGVWFEFAGEHGGLDDVERLVDTDVLLLGDGVGEAGAGGEAALLHGEELGGYGGFADCDAAQHGDFEDAGDLVAHAPHLRFDRSNNEGKATHRGRVVFSTVLEMVLATIWRRTSAPWLDATRSRKASSSCAGKSVIAAP
jgi:hypothetical protein